MLQEEKQAMMTSLNAQIDQLQQIKEELMKENHRQQNALIEQFTNEKQVRKEDIVSYALRNYKSIILGHYPHIIYKPQLIV